MLMAADQRARSLTSLPPSDSHAFSNHLLHTGNEKEG
jgi:hypothetical protein